MGAALKIKGGKGTEIGPFGLAAMELHGFRLALIPVGGDDGKVPLVKWATWKRLPGRAFLEKLAQRHSSDNIGVLTGLSGVTVVDIDDPSLTSNVLERFGDTPLKTMTPSGGTHLWYRSAGEQCADLRHEGWAVDVKGIGGFVVVPPSIRPSGVHAGKSYRFIAGSWDDLPNLPTIRAGSLPTKNTASDKGRADSADVERLRTVKKGQRNDMLFRLALRDAKHCDDEAALLDVMLTKVGDHFEDHPDDPFTDAEIRKAVASAWSYEDRGTNWAGTEAKVYVTASEANLLAGIKSGGDALLLLTILRLANWSRNRFPASPKAMAEAQMVTGWGHQRYRDALVNLTEAGLLKVVHPGGNGLRDPRLFAFATPVIVKGTETGPNITKHPPPVGDETPAVQLDRPDSQSTAQRQHRRGGSGRNQPATDLPPLPGSTVFGASEETASRVGKISVSSSAPMSVNVQLDLPMIPPAPRLTEPKAFGTMVRDARKARQMAQAEAAKLAGMSRSGFGNIETGTYPASLETQLKLAEVFGLRLAA